MSNWSYKRAKTKKMAKISKTRGKNFELAIAKYLKCKRNHFEKEDLCHPILSIECKHRTELPKLIKKWMAQAEAAAQEGKIACVVMHEERQKYGESLVIMRLKDIRDLLGTGDKE